MYISPDRELNKKLLVMAYVIDTMSILMLNVVDLNEFSVSMFFCIPDKH